MVFLGKKAQKQQTRRARTIARKNPGRQFGFAAGTGGPVGSRFGPGPSSSEPLFGQIGSGQIRQTARQPVVRNVSRDMFSPRGVSQFKILSGDDLSEDRKKRKKKFKKKLKGLKKKKAKTKRNIGGFAIARVPFG